MHLRQLSRDERLRLVRGSLHIHIVREHVFAQATVMRCVQKVTTHRGAPTVVFPSLIVVPRLCVTQSGVVPWNVFNVLCRSFVWSFRVL